MWTIAPPPFVCRVFPLDTLSLKARSSDGMQTINMRGGDWGESHCPWVIIPGHNESHIRGAGAGQWAPVVSPAREWWLASVRSVSGSGSDTRARLWAWGRRSEEVCTPSTRSWGRHAPHLISGHPLITFTRRDNNNPFLTIKSSSEQTINNVRREENGVIRGLSGGGASVPHWSPSIIIKIPWLSLSCQRRYPTLRRMGNQKRFIVLSDLLFKQ